jgi:hypothetical protein
LLTKASVPFVSDIDVTLFISEDEPDGIYSPLISAISRLRRYLPLISECNVYDQQAVAALIFADTNGNSILNHVNGPRQQS